MFDSSAIFVGLEVGTSKICAVVGEVGDSGVPNIIGIGQCASRGVRKGEIVDTARTEEDIRHALVEAEQMANVEIRTVFLGVTGSHIRGFNNRGIHPIVSDNREITEEDLQDVIKNAKAINLPVQNHVVHSIRQGFLVDGHDGYTNPVGLLGSRLEADMHVVHGNLNRLQNTIGAVNKLRLKVEDIAFTGLASSLAVLPREAKEDGALVIDMGGGTTDVVVYAGGSVKHSGVLAVGGDHLSNDLAIGLKVPLGRAEQLKIEYGGALVEENIKGQTVDVVNDFGLPLKTFSLENLRRIMWFRLEETFDLVRRDVEEAGLYDYLRAGVYLCGGCSRIPRVAELAEDVFGLPVFIGRSDCLSGDKSSLSQPEFAAAIGLVRFGANRRPTKRRKKTFAFRLAHPFQDLLGRR